MEVQESAFPPHHQSLQALSIPGPTRTTASHSLASYTPALIARLTPDSYHAGNLKAYDLRSLLTSLQFGLLLYL